MSSLLKLTNSLGPRGSLQRLFLLSKSTAAAPVSSTDRDESEVNPPKPFSEMPGKLGPPIIGGFLNFSVMKELRNTGKDSVPYRIHSKYGPIAKVKLPAAAGRWLVFVNGPEAAEAVFRAEGKYPSRLDVSEDLMIHIYKQQGWPSPLLFSAAEDWKRIRSAMGKQVIPRRVGNFTSPLCDITDDLLDHLEGICSRSDGKIEDLTPIITNWTFQSTSYFVFGESFNVFDSTNDTHQEFIAAGIEFVNQLTLLTPNPLIKYFNTRQKKQFLYHTARMRDLAKQVMERKVVQLSEDIARGTVDETKAVGILEQWLIEGKLEPEDAISQACDLLAAGLDTTKNTVTFMLFELAKQPALQDQLYHEIKAVLGDKVNPSWEDLQNIPLARNCLKEALRLYPATQMNLRTIMKDAVINGYEVPAGTQVMTSHGLMSHSEQYFDEPLKFIPERWSKDKDSIHPFASLPFGFGPRGCYGRRLAGLEIYILLTKFIPRFTLSTDKDSLALVQGTVLKPDEPVTITIRERH